MRIICSEIFDPYYNLATEEYLFKNESDDLLFVYRNSPCVVVGKHQNTIEEVNMPYALKNSIAVIRRMSGGGAVYHDLGNINYSFHFSINDSSKIDYQVLKRPIVDALEKMKLSVEQNSRNDLLISGFKISGSASHVGKNRMINHGTLLFNTDLNSLSLSLKKEETEYLSKGVKSVKSQVANIAPFMKERIDANEFMDVFSSFVQDSLKAERIFLKEKADEEIKKLVKEKYGTWEWNFGYSPNYCIRKNIELTSSNHFQIDIWVSKGIIQKVEEKRILCENKGRITPNFDLLVGKKHSYNSLLEVFENERIRLKSSWNSQKLALSLL